MNLRIESSIKLRVKLQIALFLQTVPEIADTLTSFPIDIGTTQLLSKEQKDKRSVAPKESFGQGTMIVAKMLGKKY